MTTSERKKPPHTLSVALGDLPDIEALARARGISPAAPAGDSPASFWPEGESVEDFIAAAIEARSEHERAESECCG